MLKLCNEKRSNGYSELTFVITDGNKHNYKTMISYMDENIYEEYLDVEYSMTITIRNKYSKTLSVKLTVFEQDEVVFYKRVNVIPYKEWKEEVSISSSFMVSTNDLLNKARSLFGK